MATSILASMTAQTNKNKHKTPQEQLAIKRLQMFLASAITHQHLNPEGNYQRRGGYVHICSHVHMHHPAVPVPKCAAETKQPQHPTALRMLMTESPPRSLPKILTAFGLRQDGLTGIHCEVLTKAGPLCPQRTSKVIPGDKS